MDRRILLSGFLLSAGAGSAAPLAEREKAVGASVPERFAESLSRHDLDAFAALFAENYINHQMSAAAPPPPAGMTPKQATVAFFAARLKGMPDLDVAIEATVAGDDKVAASFVYSGTHQGVYLGMPASGRSLRFTSCDIFRVSGGLVAEHWGMGDIAGVLAQIRG
jgi:steroid delta-isomerase-like uncharacterized protein